jgi:hypothetical protein
MNKIKNNMRDVARVAASTYAFAALAIMSATTAVASLPSGYTQREYIQGNATSSSDDSNAGYVITDIFPDPSQDTIDAKFTIGTGAWAKQMWCEPCRAAAI